MKPKRTFEFGGWIVSVVPERELGRVDRPQQAVRMTDSVEHARGARGLFEVLGKWAPVRPVRRTELRRLVVKEILDYSIVWRRPFREALTYRSPEPVDLRDLIEPRALLDNTAPASLGEETSWIELEVVDEHGRPVPHLRGTLRVGTQTREVTTEDGSSRHDGVPTHGSATVSLRSDPHR